MKTKKVVLTIGCPGSGKSHTAEKFCEIYSQDGLNVVFINADEIRKEFTGAEDNFSKDKQVWAALYKRFETALQNEDIDVIAVTNTSINFKTRKSYYKIINDLDMAVEFKFLVFPPDVDACMELQEGRERFVPRDIVESFAGRFEAPTTMTDFAACSNLNSRVYEYDTAYAVRCKRGLEN